jgi:hypothetical protein
MKNLQPVLIANKQVFPKKKVPAKVPSEWLVKGN